MELVFLFAVGFGIVVFILLNSGKENNHVPPPPRPEPDQRRAKRYEPFDGGTAQRQPEKTVIFGAPYVVDGDSLVIQKTQVRLFGVDAPEMNHPYGIRAKQKLWALCKNHSIRAEVVATDAHGRTVARCFFARWARPFGRNGACRIGD